MSDLKEEVLEAWPLWDAMPGAEHTAGRMQDACNALAEFVDVPTPILRSRMAANRRAGMSYASALAIALGDDVEPVIEERVAEVAEFSKAALAFPRSDTIRRRALLLIAERGEDGATAGEISAHFDVVQARLTPHLEGMEAGGWIEDGRIRRGNEIAWVATDRTRKQLAR